MTVWTGFAVLALGFILSEGTQARTQSCSAPGVDSWRCFGPNQSATGAPRTRPRNPFRNLFVPKPQTKQSAPAPTPNVRPGDASSTRVVCGTVVFQADPSVDPRMVIPTPKNTNQFAIRTITPPVCK
jgi:hypothetical protein